MAHTLKQAVLGSPLHTREAPNQRLSNPVALAVFSSDALSSVAYATGEILLVLVIAGSGALHLTWPISCAIAALLVVVTVSYRQTIKAYPGGGGAYIVAKENLGKLPGLTAGAALLVDYVLTVAVSISAGTAAITSAWPALRSYTIPLTLVFLTVVAIANLRGVRESGALFSVPTYGFVLSMFLMLGVAYYRQLFGGGLSIQTAAGSFRGVQNLTLFLVLRAFSSGCAAMTGVEAIANGTQAFRKPESTNARATMAWMAGLLGAMFLGLSGIAVLTHMHPSAHETVISQIARATFTTSGGGVGFMYYVVSVATMAILIVAANTSYADFPRLGSFMAADRFVPSLLSGRGHRLVHSNGIILLTTAAGLLLVMFNGSTSRLIPLYAIGVFTSFTLSQAGMVVHWWRSRDRGYRRSMALNAAGTVATAVVTVVVAVTKFARGGWIVLVLVPTLVVYFLWVNRQYTGVAVQLRMPRESWRLFGRDPARGVDNHVIVLVGSIDRRIVPAIQYARAIRGSSIEAVFVDATADQFEQMHRAWNVLDLGIPLTVLESPYREIAEPLCEYVRGIPRRDDAYVTVVIPQFVPEEWGDLGGVYVYRPGLRRRIKRALFFEPNVIVSDVPYHLHMDAEDTRASDVAAADGEPGEPPRPAAQGFDPQPQG